MTTLNSIGLDSKKAKVLADDEGTNAMMNDFISQQEKTVWMMKAWLNETV